MDKLNQLVEDLRAKVDEVVAEMVNLNSQAPATPETPVVEETPTVEEVSVETPASDGPEAAV